MNSDSTLFFLWKKHIKWYWDNRRAVYIIIQMIFMLWMYIKSSINVVANWITWNVFKQRAHTDVDVEHFVWICRCKNVLDCDSLSNTSPVSERSWSSVEFCFSVRSVDMLIKLSNYVLDFAHENIRFTKMFSKNDR